jgi:tetratricopeptide (TPR) repeat protein
MQPCETVDYNVWLGNRIKEILEAKKVTVRGLAKEIGIGRMTLERILDGRYATAEELEKIAKGLGVTVERIKQKDTQPLERELEHLLMSGKNPWRARRIAETMVGLAIGRTELTDAYNLLGLALYDLRDFKEAHEAWQRSLELALKLDDLNRIRRACNNLMASYHKQGQHEKLTPLLEEVEEVFQFDAEQLGRIYHYRAIIAYRKGENLLARKYFKKSYEHYQGVHDNLLIGRLQHDMAHQEHQEGNFQEAKQLLLKARKNLQQDSIYWQATVDTSLARTLICLGEREEALAIIDRRLQDLQDPDLELSEIKGKLLLMRAYISGDPTFAESVFSLRMVSKELKCNAADFLTEHYLRHHDYPSAQKYFYLFKENLPTKIIGFKKGDWF